MRRIIGTLAIIGLLLLGQGAIALIANAQSTGNQPNLPSGQYEEIEAAATWSTGFQIQNLSGTQEAHVVITYFNQDGTVAGTETNITIPAGGSVTKLQNSSSLPTGFDGSAVISSDQPIATILNQATNGGAPVTMTGSSVGFTAGSTEVSLPLIMRGNGGWDTNFHLQNADSGTANVQIVFTPIPGFGNAFTQNDTIAAGASKLYKQSTMTSLGTRFVGSAKVTSTNGKKLAATVNETNGSQLLTYDGFGAGSTNLSLPLIMKGNGGWYTGFQMQNSTGTAATGTITYKAGAGSDPSRVGQSVVVNFSIPANSSLTKIQSAGSGSDDLSSFAKFVGSASITSSQPVIVIVNETSPTAGQGMSYNGFANSAATTSVSLPLIMKGNGGYYTGFQLQNTNTSAAATGTITYKAGAGSDSGRVGQTVTVNFSIPAGQSVTKLQLAGQSSDDLSVFTKFVGSVSITSSQPVVAIVNESQIGGAGDVSMSYNGVNQ